MQESSDPSTRVPSLVGVILVAGAAGLLSLGVVGSEEFGFRIRNVTWGNLTMLVFGTAFAALFFGSILFLTQVWGWSILQAGFGVAPGPIIVGILAPRAGTLAGRVGQRPILLAGGVLFAISGVLRLALLGPEVDYLADAHWVRRDLVAHRCRRAGHVPAGAPDADRPLTGGAVRRDHPDAGPRRLTSPSPRPNENPNPRPGQAPT